MRYEIEVLNGGKEITPGSIILVKTYGTENKVLLEQQISVVEANSTDLHCIFRGEIMKGERKGRHKGFCIAKTHVKMVDDEAA